MRAIVAVGLAVFLIQGLAGLLQDSGTCDELGAHLPAGILRWKSGEFSGGLANPPLGQLLVSAGAIASGHADRPLRDDPRWLLPARLPVLALGAMTVLLIGALARRLAGAPAGAAAVGAAALCPNLVAHSRLATLDLPVTAFLAIACWAAWRWFRGRSRVDLAAWAFAFGSAALIKHSALHLLPAVALGAMVAEGSPGARARAAIVLVATGGLGLVLLAWLVYGGGEAVGMLPAPYVDALREKWAHGRGGHFAYLFGNRSTSGFPHYFVVALLVKVPLAILAAACAGVWALLRGRLTGDARGFVAFVLLPGVWILVAMSLVHRVDIGLRHVLPLFPALLALAGAGWTVVAGGGARGRWIAAGLAAWAAFAALRIAPDHLAYFNELAGGPDRGDRILIDSNLDWGQEEGRMRAWAAANGAVVNPVEPVAGIVAVNVNSLRGIFAMDDSRMRWLAPFPHRASSGHTWRIVEVHEAGLRDAAARSPIAALDLARWLIAQDRANEAAQVLERNDLSRHAEHAAEWWRSVAEAKLAAGDLAGAAAAAPRGRDPDLLAVISFRTSEARGDPWPSRDARERQGIFGALMRRDRREEAFALADRIARDHPEDAFLEAQRVRGPVPRAPLERLARAATWQALGDEGRALAEAGELLASDPGNADALWLFGELVVRRKLGLAEFPLPDVDWSGVTRRRGGAGRGARSAGRDWSGARVRSSWRGRARGGCGSRPPAAPGPRRST